jgi:hypothetical protein
VFAAAASRDNGIRGHEASGTAEARSRPARFLVAPGHELGDHEIEQVVERRESYVVVEKMGRAADIAADLDQPGR